MTKPVYRLPSVVYLYVTVFSVMSYESTESHCGKTCILEVEVLGLKHHLQLMSNCGSVMRNKSCHKIFVNKCAVFGILDNLHVNSVFLWKRPWGKGTVCKGSCQT